MNRKSGLELTLRILERSVHSRAVDVLADAMAGPDESLRDRAAVALLTRGGPRSQTEFVRRIESLGDGGRLQFRTHRALAGRAVENVLRRGSTDDRLRALHVVKDWEDFDRLAAILATAMTPDESLRRHALETVEALVERLVDRYADCDGSGVEKSTGHNLGDDVCAVLGCLLEVTRDDEFEPVHDLAVRSILVLGTSRHVAIRELLWRAAPSIRERVAETLRSDLHPQVVNLLLDLVATSYPHPVVFECLSHRSDRTFVTALLERVDAGPNETFIGNLAQVDRIDWLVPEYVDSLPPNLQRPAVRLLHLLHTSEIQREAFLDWVARHGSGEARLEAADHLAAMPASYVHEIVSEGLEDEDAGVQAWATSQLRSRAIPNGLALLVERLDDPAEEVRRAARNELSGFDLDLLLQIHSSLSPERGRQAGRLLVRTDENVGRKLREEFFHPQRSRRVQALEATMSLGLATFVEDDLLRLLDDEDPLVRRVVADCLRDTGPSSIPALRIACEDSSQRVREAAESALEILLSRERESRPNATLEAANP